MVPVTTNQLSIVSPWLTDAILTSDATISANPIYVASNPKNSCRSSIHHAVPRPWMEPRSSVCWFRFTPSTTIAGWWYTYPSKKYENQWEGLSHI